MADLEEKAFYEDRNFRFIPNWNDGPSAYDIHFGKHHLYLPDRVLNELTYEGTSARDAERIFEQLSGGTARCMLQYSNLDFKDLHDALLKVKDLEDQEREQVSATFP